MTQTFNPLISDEDIHYFRFGQFEISPEELLAIQKADLERHYLESLAGIQKNFLIQKADLTKYHHDKIADLQRRIKK